MKKGRLCTSRGGVNHCEEEGQAPCAAQPGQPREVLALWCVPSRIERCSHERTALRLAFSCRCFWTAAYAAAAT